MENFITRFLHLTATAVFPIQSLITKFITKFINDSLSVYLIRVASYKPYTIANIFVYKHCFYSLNVTNFLTEELFVSPTDSSLVCMLCTYQCQAGRGR